MIRYLILEFYLGRTKHRELHLDVASVAAASLCIDVWRHRVAVVHRRGSRIVNFRVAVVSVAAASLCIDVVRRHVAVVHRRGAAIVVCCVES